MQSVQRVARYCLISTAAIILAACAGQKEPAQKLIGDIEVTVAAASAEAAKYVPDQLADVRSQLVALKSSFAKQDYAGVLTAGPAVLSAAQGLATAAVAKQDEILKGLDDEWTALAAMLPGQFTAIQDRVDLLEKKSSRKMAAGIDLAAAKSDLSDASSLWSKSQAAFAAGTMDEAVKTARDVKSRVDALAKSLRLDVEGPAASPSAAGARS